MGVYGAEQCGEVEEWFNLRMQRVAPEACAKYLGSFVADKTRGQFTQGGKWLVWSFEVKNWGLFLSFLALFPCKNVIFVHFFNREIAH